MFGHSRVFLKHNFCLSFDLKNICMFDVSLTLVVICQNPKLMEAHFAAGVATKFYFSFCRLHFQDHFGAGHSGGCGAA